MDSEPLTDQLLLRAKAEGERVAGNFYRLLATQIENAPLLVEEGSDWQYSVGVCEGVDHLN